MTGPSRQRPRRGGGSTSTRRRSSRRSTRIATICGSGRRTPIREPRSRCRQWCGSSSGCSSAGWRIAAATGCPFARWLLHGEFLNVRGTKMSKRFGNFLTVRDLREQGVDPAALRLLFWQTHYRQPLDFTDEALAGAAEAVKRLAEFRDRVSHVAQGRTGVRDEGALGTLSVGFARDFRAALDDDLNAPRACAALFDFVRAANRELDREPSAAGAERAVAALHDAMGVLDVLPTTRAVDPGLERWIGERLVARDKARKAKDFKEADRIRAELAAQGVAIEDTAAGTKWRVT